MISGGATGLLRNPSYGARAAPWIVAGALAFIAMNILLSAGARNWLERFFLRTRLREAMMLVLVIAGLLPQFLAVMHVRMAGLMRFAPSQVVWPWAAMGRLMLGDRVALSGVTSAVWLAASWWFSRRQFERTIRYDVSALKRHGRQPERQSRTGGFIDLLFGLPSRFLPDPIAAIMEKELRTFARIPRFRLVYAMSCFFGLVLYFPTFRRGHTNSFFQQNALPVMSLYGLLMLGQISYWNSFGFDRSAAQGYFSWPVRLRDVLLAKNLSVVCLMIPQIMVVALIGRAAHLPASPAKVLETILVMIVAALYWFSVGNICSVRLPRALDPEKMNQMSNKMQALSIWSAPFLLLPLGLAYWSRWFFESQMVFGGLLLVAAIIGAIFYWVGLDSAVHTAIEKREAILSELSRSEGPLSAA
jgi:ABC-2 type transport system permease protein